MNESTYIPPDERQLKKWEERDMSLIKQFCEFYSVEYIRIDYTQENEIFEPIYFFTDNCGGYTRKGLEDSLTKED